MFHRVLGLSSILLVCLAGCSLRGHRDCGCHQHGRPLRHAANLNNTCGPEEVCTCTAPLYPGDQQCHRNCRKHRRQRPMRRMATAFRRNSPQWLSGFGACECESCCDQSCMPGPTMCGQSGYIQSSWGTQQACGCDSCATSMTDGWFPGAETSGEWHQNSADQHGPGCGCGESYYGGDSGNFPADQGMHEYSVEAPAMNIPPQEHNNTGPRSFPPSTPHGAPGPHGSPGDHGMERAPIAPSNRDSVPMPHDMTPMDPPMVLPGSSPDVFEPLPEDDAPAADKTLDPVSYEIPRLPPIPDRAHYSTVRRVEAKNFRPMEISSHQSLR
jgi:hypothetical protein